MKKEYRVLLDYALEKFKHETEQGEYDLGGKTFLICLDAFEVYILNTPSAIHERLYQYYIHSPTDVGPIGLMDFVNDIEDEFESFVDGLDGEEKKA